MSWTAFFRAGKYIPFPSEVEQQIWLGSSLFLSLQPIILLLAPQRVRARLWTGFKSIFFALYNIVYAVARLSIFFVAFYACRNKL